MILIVKWRRFFSCEGLGIALLAFSVGSDGLGLLVLSLLGMNIDAEMQLRILPNIVLTIGLLSFFCGLLVSNPAAGNIGYDLSAIRDKKTKQRVLATGYFLTCLGLFMKLYALYSAGFASLGAYFSGMYMYQATKMGGGFMDTGLNIAILGLNLLVVSYNKSHSKQFFIIMFMFAISFALSLSKSGIHSLVIISAFTLYFFNKKVFKQFAKPRFIILSLIVFVLVLGIRTQIKYGQGSEVSLSLPKVLLISAGTMGRRYGPFGVYRGYAFMVNRLVENPSLFFGTKVLHHTITGWIPRFIWPNKSEHPFHARGDLIDENFKTDRYGNDAPTFAGFAFADNGYQSLILYLFVGGFSLGLIRRIITLKTKYSFLLILGYTFFTTQFGSNMEGAGFGSMFYFIAFSLIFIFTIVIFLGLRNMIRVSVSRPRYSPQYVQNSMNI